MALTHIITDVRPYLGKYLLDIEITDTVTGQIHNWTFYLDTSPDATEQESWAVIAKERILTEDAFVANEMNPPADEQDLIDHYQEIKLAVVSRIHAFPTATLAQANTFVATTFPNSPFYFPQVYQIWLNRSGAADWDEFKAFVINHKFRGLD